MFAHAQAPVRIGIAGGGTDLPAWLQAGNTGRCLSLAIRSYTHAVAIKRPDGRVVASYRKRDEANAATEIANGLIRESALMHGWEDSFEVHTLSELSSQGSGLGVSSSIAVALAACFKRLANLRHGVTAEPRWQDGGLDVYYSEVAHAAWTVEIDRLRRPIGRQDHMAAAYGGLRLYRFNDTHGKVAAQVDRTFTPEEARWVAQHIVLIQLPEGHDSRAILAGVKTTDALVHADNAVDVAVAAIAQNDLTALGAALKLGHSSKEQIRGAVPSHIAELVTAIEALPGVAGCKIAGAGGGGHLVIACTPNCIPSLEEHAKLPVFRVEPDLIGVRSDGCV